MMMKSPVVFAVLAVLIAASASPLNFRSNDRVVVSERQVSPMGWSLAARAHPAQQVKVTLALYQRNLQQLEETYWAVATPGSPKYQEFMSIEEIDAMIAPDQADVDFVKDWLRSEGVSQIVDHSDAVSFKTTVDTAETLFNTVFYTFVHENTGRTIVKQMGEYSLPKSVHKIVDMVAGVSDFPMDRPHRRVATNDANVVPQTIYELYNIPDGTKVSNPKSSQAVIEFQNDASYNKDDLATFYKQMDISTTPISHTVGPYSGQYPDTEATLDIQYITAVGIDATNWYWTEENWMYDFSLNFYKTTDVPLVNSMSWGWSEAAQCQIDTECSTLGIDANTYVTRVNTEFQKIGLRGVSLIAASGDSGANGRTDPGCTDTQLHPVFPAASPYVTSVGATQLNNAVTKLKNPPPACSSNACASGGDEVAVSFDVASFTSGGGFSVYTPQPAYQADVVSAYLKSGVDFPPSSYFNASGRAYPDVAALGHNYLIEVMGSMSDVGGTSCASPAFAGVVALLNDYQITKTGKPLGPLNPFLYKMFADHPAAYNDITEGDNICTESGCASSCKGFKATKGWDAVTGLGSPNYVEMLNYLKSL